MVEGLFCVNNYGLSLLLLLSSILLLLFLFFDIYIKLQYLQNFDFTCIKQIKEH